MSTMQMQTQREYAAGRGPRRTIATYTDYAAAQRAVDYLSDQHFAVEHTAIVAEGLRIVEQVTGRLNYGRAALAGAASGAATGVFVGFLLGLFSVAAPFAAALSLAFWGLIFGAAIGAIIGLVGYAASGGRRDFSSARGMEAERYLVVADAEVADEAERLLAAMR